MGIVDWFIDNALELYNMYKSDYKSQTTNGGRTAYGTRANIIFTICKRLQTKWAELVQSAKFLDWLVKI